MAFILDTKGELAQFSVDDGNGNLALGHFELTIVPSFEAGTRCGDLTFVIDQTIRSNAKPQAPLDLLRGSVG
jgi:hypothetical protein